MILFPAIDLYEGKAVRLERGDYDRMTVYSDNPGEVATCFAAAGAKYLHIVDLEGARDGTTPNLATVAQLASAAFMKVQVGGGIRSEETIKKYLDAGVSRVIIGTAAVTDPDFLSNMTLKYGDKIAVGVDIKDKMAAIRGWREKSELSCEQLFDRLTLANVETVICTDISKDGMLSGTNIELYKGLMQKYKLNIIASGGVTSLDDISQLHNMNMYGAIVGKAIYEEALDLPAAVMCACGKL